MDKEIDRLLDQSLQKLPDLLLDRFRRLVLDVVDVVDVDYAIIFLCSVFYGVVRMQILADLVDVNAQSGLVLDVLSESAFF